MKYLFGLLLFLPPLLFAQDRFDGSWEMKMETIHLSGPPEEYLLQNGTYHCITCAPRVDVEMNGKDQSVTGHANFDTIAIRVLDANSVEFLQKKSGQLTFSCTETVSTDGGMMIEEFSEAPSTQGVTGRATFTRVKKGPAGAHLLSGSWQMRTIRNISSTGPITTYKAVDNGMRLVAGGPRFEAKFDSRDYPVNGERQHTVSLKLIDKDTIEQTDKQDGKVIRTTRMTLSKDGRSMRVESSDKVRGGGMTYNAEKRP